MANVTALGIVGSPRRGGNTSILVDQVLHGAMKAGAKTEKVVLADLHISPCSACDRCSERKACVVNDDMGVLIKKMAESHLWVLGTPVYWWGPTAQFKAFIDRWYGAHREISFQNRSIILAIPLEAKDEKVASYTVGMLEETIRWNKAMIRETLIAPGVLQPGAIKESKDIMDRSFQAGYEAVVNLTL